MAVTDTIEFAPRTTPAGDFGEALHAALESVDPQLSIDRLRLRAWIEREGQPATILTDIYSICTLHTAGLVVSAATSGPPCPIQMELRGHGAYGTITAQAANEDCLARFLDTLREHLRLILLRRSDHERSA